MSQLPTTLSSSAPLVVVKSTFKAFDKDGSGYLSCSEFTKLLDCLGCDTNTQSRAIKKLADDDNDGKISEKEFIDLVKNDKLGEIIKKSDRFEMLTMVSDLFENYDENKDGKISWPEWLKKFKENGQSQEDATQLWFVHDKDQNGTITFEEFWKGVTTLCS